MPSALHRLIPGWQGLFPYHGMMDDLFLEIFIPHNSLSRRPFSTSRWTKASVKAVELSRACDRPSGTADPATSFLIIHSVLYYLVSSNIYLT